MQRTGNCQLSASHRDTTTNRVDIGPLFKLVKSRNKRLKLFREVLRPFPSALFHQLVLVLLPLEESNPILLILRFHIPLQTTTVFSNTHHPVLLWVMHNRVHFPRPHLIHLMLHHSQVVW